ncbi:MAG: hypothetical protein QOJ35_4012 [Solirubrobacteraceae bacterium]|nr:hypothetical protein [Solirubrobacteraceae bacterium]
MRLPARSRALALVSMLACTLLSAVASQPAAAAPPINYSLAVSLQPDRSSAQPLAGKTYVQPAKISVFTTPTTSATRVRFYLDDTAMSRSPRSTDSSAPFDFAGTAADGSATPLDVSTLSAASHTITAAIDSTGAKTRVVSASFTVTAPVGDATKPAPAVLSAAPGDAQVALSWSAATDNVGVTRYEVWKDTTYLTQLGSTATSYMATGLTNGTSYGFRVVAYDAAGNYANSNSVIAQPTSAALPPPPPSVTQAPFPSRLKASGRSIVDENGYVLPTLRGFNMHVSPGFTWDQANFDTIAAAGGKINRAVIVWDQFEPTKGVVDATAIANLDLHVARAQAAGIYTLLELHLNVGRTPSWASDKPTELERYAAYGQTLTQYLADRYGNPASPKYTKDVIGFGLNEPPLEDSTIRNGNSSIPYLEGIQRTMISWMRAPGDAPSWIGFVAYGYASQTPIYDHTKENPNAVDASPTAFDAVGGNVVIDVHDYMAQCTNTDPSCDGRQWNGNIYTSTQGGPMVYSEQATAYTSTTVTRSQHMAYVKPYKTFSTQANIPLMLGEWGWPSGVAGESAWVDDKKAAWGDAGTVIQIQWNYGNSTTQGVWVARPNNTWRPSISAWLAGA